MYLGPLIVKKHLTITDLWNKNALDSSQLKMGKKFLHCFLTYCTREVGPSFTHSIWKKFNMRWSDYMPDNEVSDFIKSNVSFTLLIYECICIIYNNIVIYNTL